jgi:osmoprotectant transport system substrate-binding protein
VTRRRLPRLPRLPRLVTVLVALGTLAGVAACGETSEQGASQQPQGASLRVRIGTQDFPEARIIGELWRQALAVNGYAVDLRKGIGPAEDLDEALKDGDIDGYVAYTGTVLSIVAGEGEEVSGLDPQETYDRAKEFYAGQDMVMSEMTPFQNKDAIATTTAYAEAHSLRTIADLRKVNRFTLGARPEFESLYLGLEGLQQVYGLTNARFAPVALGAQYAALDNGDADAVDAFTTDPQLGSGDYEVLEDPELLFGSQNVVMVVGEKKLSSIDADAFMTVVDTVNSQLTEDAMVDMNAQVTDGRDDEAVAVSFLRSVGLMQPLDLG